MPTLAETSPSMAEQFVGSQAQNVLQPQGEFGANDRPEANTSNHEQITGLIDASIPVTDQRIDGTISQEMPKSHPEVDAATISVRGLIKNCPHFAEMHKNNPERAKAEATQAAQKAQEVSALREQGLSAKEIKAKMMAENLARAKEKAKAVVAEQKIKVEQKTQPIAESVPEKIPPIAAQTQIRNSIKKPEPSNPLPIDGPAVDGRAIEQERRRHELLSAAASIPVASILSVQQYLEQSTKLDGQELAVETQISDAVEVQRIKPLLEDADIQYQKLAAIQDRPDLIEIPENPQPFDLPLNSITDQDSVREVVVDGDANKTPNTVTVKPAELQQVMIAVDAETVVTLPKPGDFLEAAQAEDSEIDKTCLSLIEIAKNDVGEVTTEQSLVADKGIDLQFEPDVIDTYDELLVVLENEMYEPIGSAAQPDGMIDVSNDATVAEENTTQDFESIIVTQTEDEEYMTLESIIEKANEQPLEQTLVRLARHLSDIPAENQEVSEVSVDAASPLLSDERIELNTILQEIAELLPNCYSVNEDTQEKRIKITPEMTQKLLTLLRNLGYEQPSEVLVEFARSRRLGFLLQATQYMHELNHRNEWQKFLASNPVSNLLADKNELLRMGKVLFRLIMYKLAPDSVPSSIKLAA